MVGEDSGSLWQTHSRSWLAWSEGHRPLGAVLHSSNESGELSQWLCHDNNTINIGICVIIIIIIIAARVQCWDRLQFGHRVTSCCCTTSWRSLGQVHVMEFGPQSVCCNIFETAMHKRPSVHGFPSPPVPTQLIPIHSGPNPVFTRLACP